MQRRTLLALAVVCCDGLRLQRWAAPPRAPVVLSAATLDLASVTDWVGLREADESLLLDFPPCAYLMPQKSRGWKGRAWKGEDEAKWYDALGERNGPPANFWRQNTDQMVHGNAFKVVFDLLDGGSVDAAEALIERLESRNGIRTPQRHRGLLAKWAPVLVNGILVGRAVDRDAPIELSYTVSSSRLLEVPAILEIRRLGERVTTDHRYGTFDAHLEPDELLSLALTGPSASAETTMRALDENTRRDVPWERADGRAFDVAVGGISLLSDYILVQRSSEGSISDVWVRCDAPRDAPGMRKDS